MPKNYLDFYYQNVRGLRTKTKNFYLSTLSCNHDIITLTETNLCSSINDSELFDTGEFVVYRADRSSLNSSHASGGGALIAVRSCIASERIFVPDTENVEAVFVKLNVSSSNIYVGCIYIPSGSPVSVYCSYAEAINKFIQFIALAINDSVFITGDFNMRDIEWSPDPDKESVLLPGAISSSGHAALTYSILSSNLSQVNHIVNPQGRILDLVFCSDPDNVSVGKSESPLSRLDYPFHEATEFRFTVADHNVIKPNEKSFFYDFKNADLIGLKSYFSRLDWDHIFSNCSNVDHSLDKFYELLLCGFDQFVPMLPVKSSNHPPWYTRAVINLKNKRNRAHKKYSNPKCQQSKVRNKAKFVILNKEFQRLTATTYNRYIRNVENDIVSDPGKFWNYVDSKKRTKGYPSTMKFEGEKASTPEDICKLFSDFFKKVYVPDDESSPTQSFGIGKVADVYSYVLTKDEVNRGLKRLDTSKGCGPDNVSPLLLKNCANELSSPLHYLFNLSLSVRIFPDRWKISELTPIHKSGSRNEISNYRGVAILPTIGKLFESIVCVRLTTDLSVAISQVQHGFLKGRSTVTNLIEFTNYALKSIESGSQVDAIYTDIRKAFDQVRHRYLIQKLNELGVHSCLLEWINSYLENRVQCVKVLGWKSATFGVPSGLPQGSHLGPFLFILFFNDATKVFQSAKLGIFADDLKMYSKVNSLDDVQRLQRDIELFSDWCKRNALTLSIDKCKSMSFHRKSNPIFYEYTIDNVRIGRVREFRDLGVILDEKLNFNSHIASKVSKAYSMLGFLKRICHDFRNVKALTSIYNAHVRSHLEYASVLWNPSYDIHSDKIESVQKQFVIYALRRTIRRDADHKLPPYSDRCSSLDLETLARRRTNSCIFFVFDLLTKFINSPQLYEILQSIRNVPSFNFRVVDVFKNVFHRTNYGSSEPINSATKLFNKVSHLLVDGISRGAFRNMVKALRTI